MPGRFVFVYYCAPAWHELQVPTELLDALRKLQNTVILVSSPGLSVEGWNDDSVTVIPGETGILWTAVCDARIPGTRLPNTPGPAGVAEGEVGLQIPPVPIGVRPTGVVASSLITIDVGRSRPI